MASNVPAGVVIFPPPVRGVLEAISRAEAAGVGTARVPSWPIGPDGLAIATAAAARTSRIGLATGISITKITSTETRT